jgi:uncharacterized membrane protein
MESGMLRDTLLVYSEVADALADYETVNVLHTEAGLIDACDAAVIERNDKGKVKVVKKHDLGETLDEGQAGLVVLAVSDMEAKVRAATKHAEKVQEKQLKVDQEALEAKFKDPRKA